MKKIILYVIMVFTPMISFAQSEAGIINEETQKGPTTATYRLFPTENMWTFIKLNTRNGLMWQVQFHIETDNRFETYLNFLPLVDKEKEVDGRFTLYPTQNMWTFILLDQYEGSMWQVQWSMNLENRVVIPIE